MACALLILIAPDQAEGADARWTRPAVIEETSTPVARLAVGVGAKRYVVTAWIAATTSVGPETSAGGGGPLWVSVRHRDERDFTRPRLLSDANVQRMELAVATNGQTVLVWQTTDGTTYTSARDPASGWSEPRPLAVPATALLSDLRVARDGTAIVTWRDEAPAETAEVWAAIRAPGAVFGSPSVVAVDDAIGVFGPVAAIARDGSAVITWSGRCPLDDADAREPTRVVRFSTQDGSAGAWGPVEEVARSRCPTSPSSVDIADDGTVLLVINGSLRAWDGIRASLAPPTAPFPGAALISRRGVPSNFALGGVSASGDAVVVWSAFSNGGSPRGVYASTSTGHGFGRPSRISSAAVSLQGLAVDATGGTIVTWQSLRTWRIEARVATAPGRWRPTEHVTPPITPRVLATSVVAGVRATRAIVAWSVPDRRTDVSEGVLVSARRA